MDTTDWSVEKWNKQFAKGGQEFMSTEVDKRLLKHEADLLGGRANHKMYFPLCGHAPDMKWAYDKGYEVIGVDCVVPALRQFFNNHNIKFTEEACDAIKGTLLQSEDKRIRLYGCDIKDFNSDLERGVTAVWDSAAIVALNKGLRQTYCDIIKSMMTSGARGLFTLLDYDGSVYPGPPHRFSVEELQALFGDGYQLKLLEKTDFMVEMREMYDSPSSGEAGPKDHHHDPSHGSKGADTQDEKDPLDEQFLKLKEFWGSYVLVTKQ